MQQGTVKWFNDEKGYGFIEPDEKGKDLFVHHTAINMKGRRTLEDGARVSFNPVRTERGIAAHEVTPL